MEFAISPILLENAMSQPLAEVQAIIKQSHSPR